MLKRLFSFLRGRDRLVTLSRAPDRAAFLHALRVADIYVIAAMRSDGLDPATFTPDQLLRESEKAVKDLAESQGFDPFVYPRNGYTRLPFFTSLEAAKVFIGEYSRAMNRVYPFELLGVKGALLGRLIPWAEVVVMNDWTSSEYVLSSADLDELSAQEFGIGSA